MEFSHLAILLTENCNAHCKMCCDSCKLRSNGMPVPLLRNGYSIFNGTKYR